jgi:hypothetical protein
MQEMTSKQQTEEALLPRPVTPRPSVHPKPNPFALFIQQQHAISPHNNPTTSSFFKINILQYIEYNNNNNTNNKTGKKKNLALVSAVRPQRTNERGKKKKENNFADCSKEKTKNVPKLF